MEAKSNDPTLFLQNLRYYINETGLKDYEVAKKIGIHRVSLSRIVTEGRIPRKSALEKIAKYFGLSPYDMVHKNLLPYQPEEIHAGDIYCEEIGGENENNWKQRALAAEKKLDELKNVMLMLADNADTIRRIFLRR